MICDLSIEALLRFARLNRRMQVGLLNIPGLTTEHLAPMVAAGWLSQSKASPDPRRAHSPFYEITDAGRQIIDRLTAHLRALLP